MKEWKQEHEVDKVDEENRRVPVGEFLKLKKVSFLLYITLQHESSWSPTEEHRYVDTSKIKKERLAKQLQISRPTLNTYFKELESNGLIEYYTSKDGLKYIILPKVGDYYVIINWKLSFYRAILRRCDETLLRVLLFHHSYNTSVNGRKPPSQRKSYTITLEYIARCIGASENHLQNIIDCNKILEGLDIIRINKDMVINPKDGSVKTINYYTYLKR